MEFWRYFCFITTHMNLKMNQQDEEKVLLHTIILMRLCNDNKKNHLRNKRHPMPLSKVSLKFHSDNLTCQFLFMKYIKRELCRHWSTNQDAYRRNVINKHKLSGQVVLQLSVYYLLCMWVCLITFMNIYIYNSVA